MSTLKERIIGLGEKFGIKLSVEEPATTVKMMAEAKTKDGLMIYTPAEAWAEGVECYVMDETGNPAPAPDAEYVLESGETVVVAGGKVATYKTAEAKPEEMTQEELAAVVDGFEKKLNEYTTELADLKAKLTATETKLSAAETEATAKAAKVSELEAEVTKLSATPATKSLLKGTKFELNAEKSLGVQGASQTLIDRVKQIRESHKN